jgi:dipeptidyl aminopeptidase/acylaminoacyl peptidase
MHFARSADSFHRTRKTAKKPTQETHPARMRFIGTPKAWKKHCARHERNECSVRRHPMRICRPAIIALVFAVVSPAAADLPPLIPRDILFGNPEKANPQISPDGKYLTYLAPDKKNVLQLWIRTIDKADDRALTAVPGRGIRTHFWTHDGEQLIYLQDANGDENFHLVSINIKSRIIRDLTPFQGITASLVALEPRLPREALVALNLKDRTRFDVYRLNLRNGAIELDTENPGTVFDDWSADTRLQVRAASAARSDGGYDLLVRASPADKWQKLRHWGPEEQGETLGFSEDGKTLYLRGNHGANAIRLTAVALDTRKETVIAEDPDYDVSGLMIHPLRRTIQGVSFNKEKIVRRIFDKSIEEDVQVLSKVREGHFSLISRDTADRLWLIAFHSDVSPTYYYLYHRDKKESTFLFTDQPRLAKAELAPMRPIFYEARDGLVIHGYLTTPVGIAAKSLPGIVLVHGGPWDRDSWGFNSTVQWLANRGYAVLQVNFRGSAGYGKKFLNAGNREWGRKMQDDLIDGVHWLTKQGIADAKKIGIMGASYGGYATLAGLTFTPDVFACGVDLVGPSNLITEFSNIPAYWGPLRPTFAKRVGNPLTEIDFLKARSPLFHVDRIKAPLLIGQGANDPRVPRKESDQVVSALRMANKPVEYVVYADEGHGFTRPENRLHFCAVTEAFLFRHLGGRAEPAGVIKGHAGTSQ